NYGVYLTSAWYQDYKNSPPNRETLLALNLPIFIFHGELDANVSEQGVYDIEEAFQKAGKDNLTPQVFPGADHDLNYVQYLYSGQIPDGFRALLDTCAALPE
ncbi:MAG: dienelactone hydrolase family protein, partial [Bacillota bacterium]